MKKIEQWIVSLYGSGIWVVRRWGLSHPIYRPCPLIPIYRLLDYEWRPEATGSVDLAIPGIDVNRVTAAMVDAFTAAGFATQHGVLDGACLTLATRLAPDHDPSR